ncbi:flagellar basal body-associated FliL family protein [Primorskyibacter sp. S187A]|uniref:flagellar basal body-associated FliL family protein n=1 Tax=Primorskyibacter sp. S187A TaxID=3415130 RepID=UPI003C7A4BB4
MTDAVAEEELEPKKTSKLPMLIGLILALLGGGGGFFAVYSGMILGSESSGDTMSEETVTVAPLPDLAFVEIEPLIISIGAPALRQHLRFRAHLEVNEAYKSDVEKLLPRVVDVMNSYLRALDIDDLEDSLALHRLRSQLLRRVELVTGEGRVNDILIMEFVLN